MERTYTDGISIHAPRVGGDGTLIDKWALVKSISIHAPRVGGDGSLESQNRAGPLFQSTPPVWGAT